MTEEQILKLAKSCGMDNFTGRTVEDKLSPYWECWEEQLLTFALAIHEDGYNKGYDKGCEDGYESAKVSTEMNTWSSDDD
jgi:hypothetical protein